MQDERQEPQRGRAPYQLPGSYLQKDETRLDQRRRATDHQVGGRQIKRRRSGTESHGQPSLAHLRSTNSRATKRHFESNAVHGKKRARNQWRAGSKKISCVFFQSRLSLPLLHPDGLPRHRQRRNYEEQRDGRLATLTIPLRQQKWQRRCI